MDVRKKLVELLSSCPCESDCEGKHGSCPDRKNGNCNEIFKLSYCAVSKLAQHLIAHGVTVQKHCHKAESVISKTGLMCTVCHSDIDRGAVFCKYCGAKVMPQPPKER